MLEGKSMSHENSKNLEYNLKNSVITKEVLDRESLIINLVKQGLLTKDQSNAYAIFKPGTMDNRCVIQARGTEYYLTIDHMKRKIVRKIADIADGEMYDILYIGFEDT
jgi:hypothetical protein